MCCIIYGGSRIETTSLVPTASRTLPPQSQKRAALGRTRTLLPLARASISNFSVACEASFTCVGLGQSIGLQCSPSLLCRGAWVTAVYAEIRFVRYVCCTLFSTTEKLQQSQSS